MRIPSLNSFCDHLTLTLNPNNYILICTRCHCEVLLEISIVYSPVPTEVVCVLLDFEEMCSVEEKSVVVTTGERKHRIAFVEYSPVGAEGDVELVLCVHGLTRNAGE